MNNKLALLVVIGLLLAYGVNATPLTQLDYVNIGDTASEAGHSVNGWSAPMIWTGGYGGGDDGTFRTVIPNSPGCAADDKIAYFTMSTTGTAQELEVRHLMGSLNDAYVLNVFSAGNWIPLTPTSDDPVCVNGECWYTDHYTLGGLTGTINFQVVALIDPIPTWCENWGANAFSWARLNGQPNNGGDVPEFGTLALGLTVVGAIAGLAIVRRRV